MKKLLVAFILATAGCCFGLTLDDVVKLSRNGASADLIIEVVRQEGMAAKIGGHEAAYLKEQGVQDSVIEYLLMLRPSRVKASVQAGKAVVDNMRVYYTTGKSGEPIRVITNLDEHGGRLGPPPPAPAQAPDYAFLETYQPPVISPVREVVVSEYPEDMYEDDIYYPFATYYGGYYPYPSWYPSAPCPHPTPYSSPGMEMSTGPAGSWEHRGAPNR